MNTGRWGGMGGRGVGGSGWERTQSSLSEDIYILQSAPWIRIVEFPLIKEEGNVLSGFGEAGARCSTGALCLAPLPPCPLAPSPPRLPLVKWPRRRGRGDGNTVQMTFLLLSNMTIIWMFLPSTGRMLAGSVNCAPVWLLISYVNCILHLFWVPCTAHQP